MCKLLTRKRLRWLGAIALVLDLLYATITLTPWSIDMCGEEIVGETYSPDGKYLARAYVRSCGATTGFLTHVNIRSRWSYFNPTWYGVIDEGQVFSISNWNKVNLVWKDNSNLEIQCSSCAPHEKGKDYPSWEQDSWENIKISYRQVEIK